jgi:hypothetical protein
MPYCAARVPLAPSPHAQFDFALLLLGSALSNACTNIGQGAHVPATLVFDPLRGETGEEGLKKLLV